MASRLSRVCVVCTTTPTRLASGRARASAADPTTWAPGAWPRMPSTSGWPAWPTTTTS